jgi:SAM-dependent methyltransferase
MAGTLARSRPGLALVERYRATLESGRTADEVCRFLLSSYLRFRGLPCPLFEPVRPSADLVRLDQAIDWADLSTVSSLLEALPERDGRHRDLGAYATSADVAHYLARNTIVPLLLERAGSALAMWLVRADPGRYLADASRPLPRRLREPADLVSLNVDLELLLCDVCRTAHRVWLKRLKRALGELRVVDPTCGTGAFLLAALRVLEPIHRACGQRGRGPDDPLSVRARLVADHLFGVDLSPEAVALCRLRLWLEQAALAQSAVDVRRIELALDNVRAGNALVGRVRRDEPAAGFDWWDAFAAVRSGGFDVVLGNPPYLELRQVDYAPSGFACQSTGAVHALCVERSLELLRPDGWLGLVLPMAVASTQRMRPVQRLLEGGRSAWYAHFSWRPARLLAGVHRAVTLVVSGPSRRVRTCSTAYQKWASRDRPGLLDRVRYVEVPRRRPSFWVPKLGDERERGLLARMLAVPTTVGDFVSRAPDAPRVYYRTDGGLYWKVFTSFPPSFRCNGVAGPSTRQTSVELGEARWVAPVIAALSSDLFWWWYTVTSNCRHLNPVDMTSFPLPASALEDLTLAELGRAYEADIVGHSRMTQSFRIRRSRPLVERIGASLAPHYPLTADQLAFVSCYDLSFRLGPDAAFCTPVSAGEVGGCLPEEVC